LAFVRCRCPRGSCGQPRGWAGGISSDLVLELSEVQRVEDLRLVEDAFHSSLRDHIAEVEDGAGDRRTGDVVHARDI
jgi:hypothetical protein